ncbi:MAG: hypothetical protein ACP5N2_04575 [Candidatus Nanoarchaeia archaeon]
MGEVFRMKWVVFFFILVLSTFFVSAESKVVHNEWHEYSDTFKLDNMVFDLLLSPDDSLLRVRIDNDSVLFIHYEDCDEFDVYDVCYVNQSLEVPTATFEGADARPGIKINISKQLGPNLVITPQIPKIKVEEQGKLNFTIENKEPIRVSSFRLEVSIPSDVVIRDQGDFQKVGNKLILTGSLNSKDDIKSGFQIISSKGGSKKANYTIWMTGDGVTRNKTTSFNIDIALPFQVTSTLTPSAPSILEKSKFKLVIKNTASKDITVSSIEVEGSKEGYYSAQSGLRAVGIGKYEAENQDVIKPGETKEYYVEFVSGDTGRYNFTSKVNVLYNGLISTLSSNKSIVYAAKGMAPSIIANKAAVLGGEEVEVAYYVVNTNEDMAFYDIVMTVRGGFGPETLTLSKLNPDSQKELLRKKYLTPLVEKDTTYKINATIDYFTLARERRQLNITKDIKVTSNGTIISIDQKTNVKEVYTGQEFIVDISVVNMKEELFSIVVNDTIPEGVEIVGGKEYREYTLKGKQTDVAYSYKIFVPAQFEGNNITLTTSVVIPDYNYVKNDSTVIKVKKNLSLISALLNSSNGTVVEGTGTNSNIAKDNNVSGIDVKKSDDEEKKDTAFRRFFRGVENFFTNLF